MVRFGVCRLVFNEKGLVKEWSFLGYVGESYGPYKCFGDWAFFHYHCLDYK